jgi:DegV family protein with EDD domain
MIMTVHIVTDSACDVPQEFIDQYRISVVPLYINIGNQSYLDGVDMSREYFYTNLDKFPHHPQTAAPGSETFTRYFDQAGQFGDDQVFSIHVAENLSATFSSAQKGALDSKFPVTVHNSGQLALGAGMQVMAAARAAKDGASLKEIKKIVEDLGRRTYLYAVVDTMKFLQRSGRLNLTMLGVGSLLHIKPLLKMHEDVVVSEKVTTHIRAILRLLRLTELLGPLEHLSMVHTNAIESAHKLYEKASNLIPNGNKPFFQSVTPVIGTHIGPNAVGFVAVTR